MRDVDAWLLRFDHANAALGDTMDVSLEVNKYVWFVRRE